jgi:putative FmdB family regulatory protein
VDIGDEIPPSLPLPSGPEALLGRRQKGGIPLFGKEGLGEISGRICLLNYGLLGNLFLGKGGRGMPSYDYRCPNCKKKFTAMLSMREHDAGKAKCPKCGGKKLEQLITGFQVKTSRKS